MGRQRRPLSPALALALALSACPKPEAPAPNPAPGPAPVVDEGIQPARWRAFLHTRGGPLYFPLELKREGEAWSAVIENGEERVIAPVTVDGPRLIIDFPHYDSRIEATYKSGSFAGTWRYRRKSGTLETRFWTRPAAPPVPTKALVDLSGRWAVDFADSDEPAVGVFAQSDDGTLTGTVLTSTGDYRYLSGEVRGREMTLSTFDGSHAFLLRAKVMNDELSGAFYSGAHYEDTFRARRDEAIQLPDAGELSRFTGAELGALEGQDLDGKKVKLSDFLGKPVVFEVFGSWCPNCHDAAPVLGALHARYRDRGLQVVGLAFEHSGNLARDTEQLKRFRARYDLAHPILLMGTSDKSAASQALPFLDQLKAFPTTIFLDAEGKPALVHTGFSGPATGAAFEETQARFDAAAQKILGG